MRGDNSCFIKERKWAVQATNSHCNTAAAWAARREEIVRILPEPNDVDPNAANKDGRTPLSWAAVSGHGGIERILLKRNDVNPDTPEDTTLTCCRE